MQYFIEKRIRFKVTIGGLSGHSQRLITDYARIGPDLATNVLCFYTDPIQKKFLMGKISPHQTHTMEKIVINRIPRGFSDRIVQCQDYVDVEDIHCLLLPIVSA